jgi:hypothetical protein
MAQHRLIEENLPLKKISEDSKHEKNVRHGHIGTLHIGPARPLYMQLWAAGNLDQLNAYAAERGLSANDIFCAKAQAILEMAGAMSRERTLLEAVEAWGRGRVEPAIQRSGHLW